MVAVESVPLRSGTSAEWVASTLILGVGELGLDTDAGVIRVGDGVTPFADLPDFGGSSAVTGPAVLFGLDPEDPALLSGGKFTFSLIDDGRAAPRPDLVNINGSDDTVLDVAMGGDYVLMLTVAPRANGGVVETPGELSFVAQIRVNNGSEAPAYYQTAQTYFTMDDTGYGLNAVTATILVGQPLEAGDTLSVSAEVSPVSVEATDILWASGSSWLSVRRAGDWVAP